MRYSKLEQVVIKAMRRNSPVPAPSICQEELHRGKIQFVFALSIIFLAAFSGCKPKTENDREVALGSDGVCASHQDAGESNENTSVDDSVVHIPYHWELIDFSAEKLMSLSITITESDAKFWTQYCNQSVAPVDLDVDDERILQRVGKFLLPEYVLCLGMTEHGAFVIPAVSHGHVTITSEKRRITIWLSEFGFSLEQEHPEGHSRFYSLLLANELNDTYLDRTGTSFPDKMSDCFSGVNLIIPSADVKTPHQ